MRNKALPIILLLLLLLLRGSVRFMANGVALLMILAALGSRRRAGLALHLRPTVCVEAAGLSLYTTDFDRTMIDSKSLSLLVVSRAE